MSGARAKLTPDDIERHAARSQEIGEQAAAHFNNPQTAGSIFIPTRAGGSGMIPGNNNLDFSYHSIEEAFPDVDPGLEPCGSLILVMLRQPKMASSGGVMLTDDARRTEFDNTQVGKVIAVGPLAFHNRDDYRPWPEGVWCNVGDFVRVPKYQGDRFGVAYQRVTLEYDPFTDATREREVTDWVHFVLFKDIAITARYTGDPLAVRAFI